MGSVDGLFWEQPHSEASLAHLLRSACNRLQLDVDVGRIQRQILQIKEDNAVLELSVRRACMRACVYTWVCACV